jgi:hypothetical protein
MKTACNFRYAVFIYKENLGIALHSALSPHHFFLSAIQYIKRPEKQAAE